MTEHVNRSAAQLFNNPAFSDVKIKQISAGGEERVYHAHKAVLCMESRYFLTTFTGDFKEASEGTIELYDDDPNYFEFLLKYIYTYRYDTAAIDKLSPDKASRIAVPICIYAVADKYDVPSIYRPILRDVCSLWMAEKNKRQETLALLRAAVRSYYQTTARADGEMGKLIASTIFLREIKFMKTPEYEQMLKSYTAFGADMALAAIRKPSDRICVSCSRVFCLQADIMVDIVVEGMGRVIYCPYCSCKQN